MVRLRTVSCPILAWPTFYHPPSTFPVCMFFVAPLHESMCSLGVVWGASWVCTARPTATAHRFSVAKEVSEGEAVSVAKPVAMVLTVHAACLQVLIMPPAASKTSAAAKNSAAAKRGTRAQAVAETGQTANPDSTAASKATTKTRSSPRKPPSARPRTGTGSTAALQSAALLMKRAAVQKRTRDVPTEPAGSSSNSAGLSRALANPIDGSSGTRRVMQEAPAPPPRKRVAGAAASVSGRRRVDSGGVQQARDADFGEVAALRDARDKGNRTFLVLPSEKPHRARVFSATWLP